MLQELATAIRSTVIFVAFVGGVALPLLADDSATERIRLAVRKEIDAGLFPGAVVLVGTEQQVLFHDAFGLAQTKPRPIKMQKDTLFDMASVTKVVATSTACALLVADGKLDPDRHFTEYLPGHAGSGTEAITLRRLASHTSGYPEHPQLGRKARGEAMFAELLRESPSWDCNSRYQYACRNAIILSTIVEQVSGESFGSFCQRRIFNPLEMNDTQFNRVDDVGRAAASHSPTVGASSNIDVVSAGRAIGNAGMFSTAADLANFCQMMLSGGIWEKRRLLPESVVNDFTRRSQLPQFPGRGFLWEVEESSIHRPTLLSPRAYGHSGYTGQSVWVDPVKGIFILVLTNRTAIADHYAKKPEQYRARARIGDAALRELGYATR